MCHVFLCKAFRLNLFSLEEQTSITPINQKLHRDFLVDDVISHDLPFSFVEYEKN